MKLSQFFLPFMAGVASIALNFSLNAHSSMNNKPLGFIPNKGQITDQYHQSRSDIDFRLQHQGLSVFIKAGNIDYQFYEQIPQKKLNATEEVQISKIATYRMSLKLLNANTSATVTTEQLLPYKEIYYHEGLPEQGIQAQSVTKIVYKNVYPNIDWVIYTKDAWMEYDFILHPGAHVEDIQLHYQGATDLKLLENGGIKAFTPMGTIMQKAPVSFQLENGKPVASSFNLNGDLLTFTVAPHYGTLIIDPVVSWSTYFGDVLTEQTSFKCLTTDEHSATYIAGNTPSVFNIATTGSHQDTLTAAQDAFLAKFDNSGNIIWATYYGGNGNETAGGLVHYNEHIILTGHTNSDGAISTSGSYQQVKSGSIDVFLAKFDLEGTRIWGTYYGGPSGDQNKGVTVDHSGNIYLTGNTSSLTGIATEGVFKSEKGSVSDAFLTKFDQSGQLVWGTYFGGNAADYGNSLTVDTDNHIILAGYTRSTDSITTEDAYSTTFGGLIDGFITKFDEEGSLMWSTYFGGESRDEINSICTDTDDNIYFTGLTMSSTGIASAGSHQEEFEGVYDAFIGKLNADGDLQWSTYYGGENWDDGNSIVYDPLGYIFAVGSTSSFTNISTPDAIKDSLGYEFSDGWIAKMNTDGELIWGTYYGGDGLDNIQAAYLNEEQQLFLLGFTTSVVDIATEGTYQTVLAGSTDLFLTVINVCNPTVPQSNDDFATVCAGSTFTYAIDEISGAIAYEWLLPEGWEGTSTENSINITVAENSDTIHVATIMNCGISEQIAIPIEVLSAPIPIVSVSGNVLSTGIYTNYQWYHNNVAITGADNSTYTMESTSGIYTVEVTYPNGCTRFSAPYDAALNIANNQNTKHTIHIYPNPARSTVRIVSPHPVNVQIIDIAGRHLKTYKSTKNINIQHLNPGVYYLKLENEQGHSLGTYTLVKTL